MVLNYLTLDSKYKPSTQNKEAGNREGVKKWIGAVVRIMMCQKIVRIMFFGQSHIFRMQNDCPNDNLPNDTLPNDVKQR